MTANVVAIFLFISNLYGSASFNFDALVPWLRQHVTIQNNIFSAPKDYSDVPAAYTLTDPAQMLVWQPTQRLFRALETGLSTENGDKIKLPTAADKLR